MLLLQLFESLKIGVFVSKMGMVDLVVLIILLFGACVGFMRGLSHQFPRFVALWVTVVVTFHFYERLSALVAQHSSIPPLVATMASFCVLAIGSNIVVKLINSVIKKIVTIQFVYIVETVGGLCMGVLRYVLLLSLLAQFLVLLALPITQQVFSEQSVSGPLLVKIGTYVHTYTITVLSAFANSVQA